MDQAVAPSQCPRYKRGNKRATGEKSRYSFEVKLPQLTGRTLCAKKAPKEDKTPGGRMLEQAANKTKTSVSPGGERHGVGTDSGSVGGDVFFFSQRPTSKSTNEKKEAKLLRTISKMLEENQLIRQRLITFSQAHRCCTN